MLIILHSTSLGKIPTNFLREKDVDAKAFPTLHPTGQYGINHLREIPLSAQKYFCQRLMNQDQRFAMNLPYLFMAQYIVERSALESQINLSGTKGLVQDAPGNAKKVQLNDPYNVFQKIRGSTKYWETVRNELFARVAQRGPFHIFFTLSCGEMRWPEIAASILKANGHSVTFSVSPWDGESSSIQIDGTPFDEFYSKMSNKSQLFKDEVILIVQMFDNRVKSFINNVFKSNAIKYYTFRIKFQVRGTRNMLLKSI